MTGESRTQLINLLCSSIDAKSYLEIGCNTDEVFNNVNCPHKIGVDPANGGNRRMTSDEFFAINNETFDVIFIDGLHYYTQVKKDYKNAIRCLNDGGFIVFHDMLPLVERWTVVPIPDNLATFGCWTGDVWRMAFDLVREPDIEFDLVLIDMGCGVVKKGTQNALDISPENSWEFYTKNVLSLPLISYRDFAKKLEA